MRRVVIIFGLAILVSLGAAGLKLGWFDAYLPTQAVAEPDFLWGVYANQYSLSDPDDGGARPEVYAAMLDAIRDLGMTHIRTNYLFVDPADYGEVLPPDFEETLNDTWINAALKHGIQPILILDKGVDTYQASYDIGYKIASRYKGKIKYYQMVNEVNGAAIKPGFPGRTMDDYEPAKYQAVKRRLAGLGDGIRAADPNAQRVITANWLGTAIIDQLIADGVEFEVLGWNWFSDMGPDLTHKVLDDGMVLDIPGHFAYAGKKFWLTEVNRHGGSFEGTAKGGEAAQATWLADMAKTVATDGRISGFFAYTFTDSFWDEGKAAWGIYWSKQVADDSPNQTTYALDRPKQAATKLKAYIKSLGQ